MKTGASGGGALDRFGRIIGRESSDGENRKKRTKNQVLYEDK